MEVDLVRRGTTASSGGLMTAPASAASSSSSSSTSSSVIHNNKSDRSTLLCFEASREGFLWLSRYVCFPFLLAVLTTSLASAWHYCFLPWRVFDYTFLLLLVAALHMLAVFLVYLLFTTSRTSPGYVPLDWEPPSELLEGGQFVHPTNRDFSTTNWCSKCQSHRPRRAHHCRYCQRCVLVFDHHCPWVNNCVGWGNMKYFLLLLFYATIYSGIICSSFLLRCYQVIWLEPEAVPMLTKLILVGLLMTWCAFGSGIASLGQAMILQVVYLTPSCEKAHLKQRITQTLKMPRPERLAFLQRNIRLVFGTNPALWYLPTPPAGDPFSYAAFSDTIAPDNDEQRQESLHALRQMREQQQGASTSDSEDEQLRQQQVEEEERVGGVLLTTWKAKEATAGFDPALFYGTVGPRKGG